MYRLQKTYYFEVFMEYKATLMSGDDIDRALKRIAHQIIEKNHGLEKICLVGIRTRGVPLAQRLQRHIEAIEGVRVPVGELDITLYRDDLSRVGEMPEVKGSNVDFSIEDKIVVLVDDVIYTSRTARAALEAIMKLGRPSKVQLCVLVDRGHTELPIHPNYVGKNIPTSVDEVVAVRLQETDDENAVKLFVM
ncbi:bifunctional pyr operon transcriptional regulator/uracil phosphoribosyltransferase PyrR [uncultured Ruminococcus sp.]|jgi:pyrimidine operon attenuation protein/uracil phosphoribosyltransferase|uniref:bifunctional pyr operon transcriptional regulator/uracil phosphoribosyltransferase PyrR n=2 Tax=uncultured Ruminococcus sp. TaxID=165186 RepID=UPI0029311C35|nr:bifunctional pyr operon transcriptional regulator/uracil phosphoribosyltransferase PyrR [uncultured Ruminococcus sp.]